MNMFEKVIGKQQMVSSDIPKEVQARIDLMNEHVSFILERFKEWDLNAGDGFMILSQASKRLNEAASSRMIKDILV